MLKLALIVLAFSALLECLSVILFSRSIATAKSFLLSAIAVAACGTLAAAWAATHGGWAVWAPLFAAGATGCANIARRNLTDKPERWVHRFVIYAGYAATFAAMAAAALCLQLRGASTRTAIIVFIATYVVGSTCIFVAKTITVRAVVKTIPGYRLW